MKDKLPLPSVCACCRTTIHAIFGRHYDSHGSSSRALSVIWLHDAPLAVTMRRGGIHEAAPDPSYQPQRGRVIGVIAQSAIEATSGWHVTAIAA